MSFPCLGEVSGIMEIVLSLTVEKVKDGDVKDGYHFISILIISNWRNILFHIVS